jgi:hypothetical protein
MKMRACQRQYTRSKSRRALEAAEEAQLQVDAAVDAILNPELFTPEKEDTRG